MADNRWLEKIEEDPGHSDRYVERFRQLAAEGADLHGEARLVHAMAGPSSRILDAGCGPGRVGAHLHELGHVVVGVDLDPVLIAAAELDHPGPTWLVGDLSTFDPAEADVDADFDVIVSAGNVMGFLDPATRQQVLRRLADVVADDGRIVVGFGSGGDYPFDEFFGDIEAVGLRAELRLSTWDLRPFTDDSDFLVAVLVPAA